MITTEDLGQNLDFQKTWDLQEELVRQRQAGEIGDRLLLLEHAPVYTIGRTRDQSSLRDAAHLPHPLVIINRGGQGTYHGPGQLTGYAIIDLNNHGRDLHLHLRRLEEILIKLLALHGVESARREGLTGVWIGDKKIASIGVGVRKWVSMHGFAINITNESLAPFSQITPCGLDGVSMTSLENETGELPDMQLIKNQCANLMKIFFK